jgi:PAS domain S-box-containing protein
MAVILFFCGLSFFLLGFSALMYPAKRSIPQIAASLFFLGAFGVLQGVHEWVEMLMVLNGAAESVAVHAVRLVLQVLAFFSLALFGTRLLDMTNVTKYRILLAMVSSLLISQWVLVVTGRADEVVAAVDVVARYLVGLPASFLAAYGLLAPQSAARRAGVQASRVPRVIAATACGVYGIATGLVVPASGFTPAPLLNGVSFAAFFGFPVEFLNLVAAVALTAGVRTLLTPPTGEATVPMDQGDEKCRRVFDQSPIAIELFDGQGQLVQLNQAALDMFGVSGIDDVKGFRLYDDPNIPDDMKQWLRRGEVVRFETTFDFNKVKEGNLYRTSKSGVLSLDILITPLRAGGAKTATGYMAQIQDITHYTRTQEALRHAYDEMERKVEERTAEVMANSIRLQEEIAERAQAEQEKVRFIEAIANATDGVAITDEQDRYIYVNGAFAAIGGYAPEELLGKTWQDLVPPEAVAGLDETVRKTLHTRAIGMLTGEMTVVTKGGTRVSAFFRSRALWNGVGNYTGHICIATDISERKKIEEEMIRAQKLESVGVLAGGIAHDFNNILTAIMGNISLALLDAGSEGKMAHRLKEAEKSCIRARDLTQKLLTFSRGGAPLKRTVDIEGVVRNAAELAVTGSSVKCEFIVGEGVKPVEVDEGQIRQVINNLMANAIEAMPQGGVITVAVENAPLEREIFHLTPGRYVKISVMDRGVGIPGEHLPKVFDPFFTTKHKRSGLGLAVSYSIVRKHGGAITAHSEPGGGATFAVYLPATEKQELLPLTDPAERECPPGRGRILIMDDEEGIRTVAGEMLRLAGYEVEYAVDGGEAISRYLEAKEAARPFDAVIMDLTIPGGMGGREAVTRLLEKAPGARAIVSSGYSDDPIVANFREYGFVGVVAKPYRMHDLCESVRNAILGSGPSLNPVPRTTPQ